MTDNDPLAEIRDSFFNECEELLEAIEEGLQTLDDGTDDSETIHTVFRAIHSIKGGAGAFGMDLLVDFSHHFETLLDKFRSGGKEITNDQINLCMRANDCLSDLVEHFSNGDEISESKINQILTELKAQISTNTSENISEIIETQPKVTEEGIENKAESFEIYVAIKTESKCDEKSIVDSLSRIGELGETNLKIDETQISNIYTLNPKKYYMNWRAKLKTQKTLSEVHNHLNTKSESVYYNIKENDTRLTIEQLAQSKEKKVETLDTKKKSTITRRSTIRVETERIERLVNLVGELVINHAILAQSIHDIDLSPHSNTMNSLDEFQRLTRDLQDSVMMIRTQPIKSLFQRMSRTVRECSAEVSKDIRLVTNGEQTEIDKTVIERLADPLTHMIRNAVDHGIENADNRKLNGKPEQGTITLNAAHRSGRVFIELSDDGQGIDQEKILEIATKKNLIKSEHLSPDEVENIIFMPGFSTTEEVTSLSGRGVGMDVVRTQIHELGGEISIKTEAGEGTTITISVPLTLAVLDGMIIQILNESIVIPMSSVVETTGLTSAVIDELRPGTYLLKNGGNFVPLLDLGAELGYREKLSNLTDKCCVLLQLESEKKVAIIVDDIIDQRQVVIKGLSENCYRDARISAATILGDGQIALILDPSKIFAKKPAFLKEPIAMNEVGSS